MHLPNKASFLKIDEMIKSTSLDKWERLSQRQKSLLKKSWGILTYKWRWQIAMNVPYLAIFILDRTVPGVHSFNMALISSVTSKLPIPETVLLYLGLG